MMHKWCFGHDEDDEDIDNRNEDVDEEDHLDRKLDAEGSEVRETLGEAIAIQAKHRSTRVWSGSQAMFILSLRVQLSPIVWLYPCFDIAFRFSSFGQCKAKKTHKLDNVNVYELFCKILQIFSALVRGRVACQQPCQQTSNPAIDRPFFFSGDINQCWSNDSAILYVACVSSNWHWFKY